MTGDVLFDPEMLDEIGVGMVVRDLDGVVLGGNAAAVALVPEVCPGSVLTGWPAGVVVAHRTVGGPDRTVVVSVVAPLPVPAVAGVPAPAGQATSTTSPPAGGSGYGPPGRSPDPVAPPARPSRRVLRALFRDDDAPPPAGPLTVVAIGVADTASIAASFGAAAVDEVLDGVDQVLSGAMRAADSAVRTHDERFLVALPGTEVGDAVQLVARLKEVCRRWVTTPDGRGIAVGAGVATAGAGESRDELVGRADAALGRALSGGHDRIEVA